MPSLSGAEIEAKINLRLASQNDISWLVPLAKSCYGERIEDSEGVATWLDAQLKNPDFFIARGDFAAVAVGVFRYFYAPRRPEASVIFVLGSRHEPAKAVWEAASLLKHAVLWAKGKEARLFKMDSATAIDVAPLAQRIGAKPTGQTYVLELGDEPQRSAGG